MKFYSKAKRGNIVTFKDSKNSFLIISDDMFISKTGLVIALAIKVSNVGDFFNVRIDDENNVINLYETFIHSVDKIDTLLGVMDDSVLQVVDKRLALLSGLVNWDNDALAEFSKIHSNKKKSKKSVNITQKGNTNTYTLYEDGKVVKEDNMDNLIKKSDTNQKVSEEENKKKSDTVIDMKRDIVGRSEDDVISDILNVLDDGKVKVDSTVVEDNSSKGVKDNTVVISDDDLDKIIEDIFNYNEGVSSENDDVDNVADSVVDDILGVLFEGEKSVKESEASVEEVAGVETVNKEGVILREKNKAWTEEVAKQYVVDYGKLWSSELCEKYGLQSFKSIKPTLYKLCKQFGLKRENTALRRHGKFTKEVALDLIHDYDSLPVEEVMEKWGYIQKNSLINAIHNLCNKYGIQRQKKSSKRGVVSRMSDEEVAETYDKIKDLRIKDIQDMFKLPSFSSANNFKTRVLERYYALKKV